MFLREVATSDLWTNNYSESVPVHKTDFNDSLWTDLVLDFNSLSQWSSLSY